MTENADITLYPASKLRILVAYLIDAGLAVACGLAVSQNVELTDERRIWIVWLAATIGFAAIQSLIFSQRGARTLGRRAMGLIVVSADGQKLSRFKRWMRFPLACVSWGFAGLGIVWILFDRLHRSWHDLLTGSVEVPRLIKVKKTPPRG